MMKTNKIMSGLFMASVLTVLMTFASCSKSVNNDNTFQSHLDLYLTDAPADYQAVWIDIQKIIVKTPSIANESDNGGWTEVPLVRPGLYNLLDFRNGADTVLAGVDLPAGTINQIRLILGENNSVVLQDGSEVPLTTPSAQQSGLKLNVHATLQPGIPYALVLDFDADRSIVKAGNSGKYLLKPVIRTFAKEAGGAIEGSVLPAPAHASVLAILGKDTLSTIPNITGYYKFWGLPEGSYELIFSPDINTDYQEIKLENVMVSTGEVTKIDPVELIQ